jgi:D-alanine-D-alanine ligase
MVCGMEKVSRMVSPRVLILHNQPVLPAHHPDVESEHEVLYTAEAVEQALSRAGFIVGKLGASHDPAALLHGVQRFHPDVVFNLFEGTGDDGNNEAYAAGLLHWLKIPFTGCPAQTLSFARNKALTKHLLRSAGLPTPDFLVIDDANVPECPLEWPVIVKPALQDSSVGLDQGSVVCNRQQLEDRVASLLDRYGPPVLVEEFIRGREFNVAVVELPELTVLPVSEILFVENKPGYWPIVTYDAKWRPESADYLATPPSYPAKTSLRLAKRLSDIAKEAFRLTGCRDYARVDFRVRGPGRPFILEVNPNPDFSPDAGLSGALTVAGITHSQFAIQLVHNALARASRAAEFGLGEATLLQPAS